MTHRIYPGSSTPKLSNTGTPADPLLWYWEPAGYEGDELYSCGVSSREEAEADAVLVLSAAAEDGFGPVTGLEATR